MQEVVFLVSWRIFSIKLFVKLTSAFKNGDSMGVRIPKEIVFMRESDALEIELIGNTLMLRPAAERPCERRVFKPHTSEPK